MVRRHLGVALVVVLFGQPSGAMRLVLQRVRSACVLDQTNAATISTIGRGILALVGLHKSDTEDDLRYCAKKLCAAKLWPNEEGKPWRKSVRQLEHEILLVSQFTLFGDVANKKHVPDFKLSMKSEQALQSYDAFKDMVAREYGRNGGDPGKIKDGLFGAMMDVHLVNDGPVTLIIDSPPTSDITEE